MLIKDTAKKIPKDKNNNNDDTHTQTAGVQSCTPVIPACESLR